jgi:hypothetical protein
LKYNTEFLLGLIGSTLGILGSVLWLFFGTSFIAYFATDGNPLDSDYALAFVISLIQLFLTLPFFIVTLIKALPQHIEKTPVNSGRWLLTIGIISFFLNIFLLIPSVLLIVSGSMCFKNIKNMSNNSNL